MRTRNIIAFSLIELLVTFTAVAVIAGAFAPVVSKKLMSEKQNAGSSQNLSEYCDDISKYCQLCDLNLKKCIICSLRNKKYPCQGQILTIGEDDINCDSNTQGCYLDTNGCNCKPCPEGCYRCMNDECLECGEEYHKNSKGECVKCPSDQNKHWDENTDLCVCDEEYNTKADGTCVSCTTSQYWNGEDCVDCPSNSSSQGGTATTCSCNGGYTKVGNACQKTCPENQEYINGKCDCPSGRVKRPNGWCGPNNCAASGCGKYSDGCWDCNYNRCGACYRCSSSGCCVWNCNANGGR